MARYLKDKKDRLLFVPLGGCGEIGMNLNLYAYDGKWLMVDLGMTFADETTPGIDLVFPDPQFIENEKKNLIGLVVTHGHEDHIGAIPYLWERLGCPIYATPFTAELIRGKLEEAGLLNEVPLHEIAHNEDFALGPFAIRYIPLAHSIAEGHGLAIKTAKGVIFHTGDWKIDANPLIGPEKPEIALKKLGDAGVLALVGDSTNVFNANASGSELTVRESLTKIVSGIKGRVFLTTFASNVARLETIGAIAKETGRQLVLMGRSMGRIHAAAQKTGYLQDFPDVFDERDIDELDPRRVLIACTGCQGEYRAALSRIARGEHRNISLVAGDTVIFSSKIIPGNEQELGKLFNDLARHDVDVITEKDNFVHVSGHPGQAELKEMLTLIRPQAVIPVHGEDRHIRRHADFAHECGVKHTVRPRNGDVIEILDGGAVKKIDEVPVGRLVLDGTVVLPLGHASLSDRRRLMAQGLVTVHMAIDDDGALMEEPLLSLKGLPILHEEAFYDDMIAWIEDAYGLLSRKDRRYDDLVEEACRVAVRRLTRQELGKNPVVDILITRASDLNI